MENYTDSIGTVLPSRIEVSAHATIEERICANIINSFVKQILDCMDMGANVIYNPLTKDAHISHPSGFRQTVSHETIVERKGYRYPIGNLHPN
jgi:hypothetical protein